MTDQAGSGGDSTSGATETAETLTMAGWLAKGLLFVVIGLLGLSIARRGYSGEDADQGGALSAIVEAPAGRLIVLVVGVGLVMFSGWHLWSAVTRSIEWSSLTDDLDVFLDVCRTIGDVGLAAVYGLLAVTGFQAAWSGGASSSGDGGPTSPEGISARLLDLPGGRVAVAAVGVGTILVGLYHLRKAWRRDFLDDISTEGLSDAQTSALAVLGVVGFAARSVMLAIAGTLFVVAGWQHDADEAAGLDQSLRTLAELGPGRVALGLAAAGLVAAGLYDMVTFRRQQLAN